MNKIKLLLLLLSFTLSSLFSMQSQINNVSNLEIKDLLTNLPEDLLSRIFEYANIKSLINISKTCKICRSISQDVINTRVQQSWHRLYTIIIQKFPENLISHNATVEEIKNWIGDSKNKDCLNSILIKATVENYSEFIDDLLEIGANINASERGYTILLWAVFDNCIETVKTLLEKGADPNFASHLGNTALMSAAEKGYTDILNILLDKGANVNATNKKLKTALIYAALNGQTEALGVLLTRGANVNDADKDGKTAIMIAAEINYSETPAILRLLLDCGADIPEDITQYFDHIQNIFTEEQEKRSLK